MVRAHAALKVPAGVSTTAAAVATDACLTAYHAVFGQAQVKTGETVLIIGLGGLGFNALQIALSIGARVIAMDKRQTMLEEAKNFGVNDEDIIPTGTMNTYE